MKGEPAVCKGGVTCEYFGLPAICRDCKRNTMAKKDARLDLFVRRAMDVQKEETRGEP